jgi:N-glycosylase/DNA lyase
MVGGVELEGPGLTLEAARDYFDADFPHSSALATFSPQDEWIARARSDYPGLRLLHQPVWETLVCFICSAVKQIVQIQQINRELRRKFGREIQPGFWSFPDAETLDAAGEGSLRECRLGFRARHLADAAQRVASGEIDLSALESLPTREAREQLMTIKGVGEKIANCVLLFSCRKYEVFPVDVWVERVLRDLYFARRRQVTAKKLRIFAQSHFGPYGGLAQQYLFHWVRSHYRKDAGKSRTASSRRR